MDEAADGSQNRPLSVAELTAEIKSLLEESLPARWVVGEVSNLSQPQSGHVYFTLKDDDAQIRAVMWRNTAARLRFKLHDGLQLVCHGRLDVYPPRGSYQLVVTEAQPQGIGALELALRQLRERLAAEGLFAAERKRPLPKFARRVAFVTSPTGAAIRDFLEVLRRRWSGVDVLIVPVRVQGDGAAAEIAAAIKQVNRLAHPPQILVVGRGGGSLEDLWAFNEEPVVRAIAASKIPTVSAVGHEIDVTLADLVADVRALTPSEAAELIAPSADDLRRRVTQSTQRLHSIMRRHVQSRSELVQRLASARVLRRSHAMIEDRARRVDEADARLRRAVRQPLALVDRQLATLAGRLESLSPLGVLARGYSVTTNAQTGRVIQTPSDVKLGATIVTRLAEGRILSVVSDNASR